MKKHHILLIILFTGVLVAGSACNTAGKPASTSATAQTTIPSSLTSTLAEPTIPAATAPATFTPSPLPPDPTQTATLTPSPTSTRIPFLPSGLATISAQNASKLKRVAVLPGQSASVVAFSPDNRLFAAGSFRTNQVTTYDLVTGQELLKLNGHTDPRIISYLTFSPDGKYLASGAQGWDAFNDSLIVWDAVSGEELHRFDGVLGALSPDWSLVALSQREQGLATTLKLQDLGSGEEVASLKAPSDIYQVIFSSQGQIVAAKMYNVLQDLFAFWSVDGGKLNRTQYDWVEFSYSPDGRFIAGILQSDAGDNRGNPNIFDAVTFKRIKTLTKNADSLWFTCPGFSPDGQIVAASYGDHITLWDTQVWQELASLPASGPTGLAFSPDEKVLVTYSQSGEVWFWGVVER